MGLASKAEVSGTIDIPNVGESVAVVLTTYNDAAFLREAISSVIAQKRPADEVIVVDDGSEVSPAPVFADFPQIRLLRKSNGGLSSARNAGLHFASSRYISFLDADDRLEPNAIEAGLACFARQPEAAMVYGGHRRIQADGSPLSVDLFQPLGEDPYADLLTGNRIGMHATALYRREVLLALGGFDEELRRCEDYDLYLRLALSYPIASHPEIIAEYRWHGGNVSKERGEMLQAVLAVLDRHRGKTRTHRKAWRAGQRNWKDWYETGQLVQWNGQKAPVAEMGMLRKLAGFVEKHTTGRLRNSRLYGLLSHGRGTWPPPVGAIDFGRLGTTTPISLAFGWDRGRPIDRYYIENFLAGRTADIKGRVLEVGDDAYSRRYGGSKITRQDVLHLDVKHPNASLVGDLTQPDVLPDRAFDCILVTQTLHLIFDLEQAVKRLHAALRPGGILLLTVPGISQIDRGEWGDNWCWSLTAVSIRKLFEPHFGPELEIKAYGNVFAATAFLQGAALEEVDRAKLDIYDPAYPVTITLRARKV
ncbi:MAG: glycosyl transferase family 2 [Bryobacterales bacterium]|nr:glycosyl transferase family 2 [Bryobacterales bacterium]